MFDLQNLNFDINGDGIPDQVLASVDLDGDGIEESLLLDTDGDGFEDAMITDFNGDGIIDQIAVDLTGNGIADVIADTNYDGTFDFVETFYDNDGDGVIDTIVEASDYNQDGTIDSVVSYIDVDGDGGFDIVTKTYDSDGDSILDTTKTYYDFDGDGNEDLITMEQFIDTDGDAVPDTYVLTVDENADGVYDAIEIYDFDAETGALELLAAEEFTPVEYQTLDQFDPESSSPDDVVGDPAESMECWEFQGNTQRCAVFSQKFVIEELTGREIDVEELAELAEDNGWFSEDGGTPFLNMNKLLDHYGIENEMSFHNDINDIKECLDNGGKVIVAIDADEIWYGETNDLFSPQDGANHAVEVIGIDYSDPDNPMVILNDSGAPNGCGEMVPMDMFLDAWEDSNCQMIACM